MIVRLWSDRLIMLVEHWGELSHTRDRDLTICLDGVHGGRLPNRKRYVRLSAIVLDGDVAALDADEGTGLANLDGEPGSFHHRCEEWRLHGEVLYLFDISFD